MRKTVKKLLDNPTFIKYMTNLLAEPTKALLDICKRKTFNQPTPIKVKE